MTMVNSSFHRACENLSVSIEQVLSAFAHLRMFSGKPDIVGTLFHANAGISIRFMNSPTQGDNLKSAADVSNLISRVKFEGVFP